MGEMRGHTNDRLLRACLRSMRKRAQEEVARRKEQPDKGEYFQGRADCVEEIDVLLGLGAFDDDPEAQS